LSVVTYGAVAVPILQDFTPNDVHHIVNHSESSIFFVSDFIWETLEEDKMPNLRAVFSLNDFRCILQQNSIPVKLDTIDQAFEQRYPSGFTANDVRYAPKDNSELTLLNYTSGTLGFTKGVMLSANNLAGNIMFAINSGLMHNKTRILSFLPLAHAYGCAFEFLSPITAGGHVTLLGKIPAPKLLVEAMNEVKPTIILSVPLILEKMYKKQILPMLQKRSLKLALHIPVLKSYILSTIRKKLIGAFGGEFFQIVVGGAPLNPDVERFLLKIKFPFTVGYGMTECAPLISYSPYDEFEPGSCGKLLEWMEARIETNATSSPDVGEICVKGEHVMLGYYKNEVATAAAFDEDGWFHTGDLGSITKKGSIVIRGRSKSMILGPSGQNIYPEEIEAKLDNLPCIMESIVVEQNRRLVALVYPDYEKVDELHIPHTELEKIMEENRKTVNKELAAYAAISKIVIYADEFIKTPKKSIKRYLYTAAHNE
jgi:long-chain acyl-CoA synthetase